MKKLVISILILMFFVISCSSSKKAENDTDNNILPDEDATSEDDTENDDEESGDGENPCRLFANSSGEYIYSGNGKRCGCKDGYFWAKPGCKKITYANNILYFK